MNMVHCVNISNISKIIRLIRHAHNMTTCENTVKKKTFTEKILIAVLVGIILQKYSKKSKSKLKTN